MSKREKNAHVHKKYASNDTEISHNFRTTHFFIINSDSNHISPFFLSNIMTHDKGLLDECNIETINNVRFIG